MVGPEMVNVDVESGWNMQLKPVGNWLETEGSKMLKRKFYHIS